MKGKKSLLWVTSFVAIVIVAAQTSLSLAQEAASAAPAAGSPEKMNDIRKLIELTGGGNIGEQMLDQMSEGFKQTNSEVPQSFWDDLKKEVDFDGLMKGVLPVYDKYLSHDEIKEMIKFYESSAGKKMIDVMPKVMQESYPVVMQWSNNLADKVQGRLEEKGYLKKPEETQAPAAAAPATPASTATK